MQPWMYLIGRLHDLVWQPADELHHHVYLTTNGDIHIYLAGTGLVRLPAPGLAQCHQHFFEPF